MAAYVLPPAKYGSGLAVGETLPLVLLLFPEALVLPSSVMWTAKLALMLSDEARSFRRSVI